MPQPAHSEPFFFKRKVLKEAALPPAYSGLSDRPKTNQRPTDAPTDLYAKITGMCLMNPSGK